MPDPVKYRYYDILDLNIGKEPEIYGRVYKIVDCDKFTRRFLNDMGIPVPDPIDLPKDPYSEARKAVSAARSRRVEIKWNIHLDIRRFAVQRVVTRYVTLLTFNSIIRTSKFVLRYYIAIRRRKYFRRNLATRWTLSAAFWNTTDRCSDFTDIGTTPRICTASFTISNCTIISLTTLWRSRKTYRRTRAEIRGPCSSRGWRYRRQDTTMHRASINNRHRREFERQKFAARNYGKIISQL